MCATDIFTLEGVDHLVVGNFYSKMIFVQHIPPGQSSTNRVFLLLKEMFSEHGIPKVLHSDNGPQYASAQFTNLGHHTQNLKSTLPTIQWICQSMHQVHQTCTPTSQIQLCWSTAHLDSALSYTHWHQASIPSSTVVPMPTQNNHSSQDMQQWPISHTSPWADQHMLWSDQITGQQMQQNTCTTICWSTSCNVWHPPKIWVHATVIHVLPWDSYQLCTSNGSTYCYMQRHLCECSAKAVNTVPSGTTATLQALTRHCFLAAQPALPQPAQDMHPTPAAPATLATQTSQAPAVLAMPAVQKNAPAPTSVTSHATPVQPQRSGCTCMAPRCLIQEI